jgi:hypothetical protein
MACENCVFENLTFLFGGGDFQLRNCTVKGAFAMKLTGAALNTVNAIGLFAQIAQPRKQPRPLPQPQMMLASSDTPVTITLVSRQ